MSGLTGLLHQPDFPWKLTTPVPGRANAVAQGTFLTQLAGPFRTTVPGFLDRLPECGQDLTSRLTRQLHIIGTPLTS